VHASTLAKITFKRGCIRVTLEKWLRRSQSYESLAIVCFFLIGEQVTVDKSEACTWHVNFIGG
jgi:hypothetical protein